VHATKRYRVRPGLMDHPDVPAWLAAGDRDADAFTVCAQLGVTGVPAKWWVPCAIAGCRTGHVAWTRYFMGDVPRDRDKVDAECKRHGLALDPWDPW
jgi:hypothetical protein